MNKLDKLLAESKERSRMLRAPNREENILDLLERNDARRGHSDFRDFASGQLSVLGRFSLLWELAWLACFILLAKNDPGILGAGQALPLVSMLPPFLLIIFAADLGRVTARSMLEIEAATKYSVSQILLFRLLVHSAFQLMIVFGGILVCRQELGFSLARLLVYGYTPLVFSGAVLLACLSRFSGRALRNAGAAITVMTVLAEGTLRKVGAAGSILPDIFDTRYEWLWELTLGISAVWYAVQVIMIRKEVSIHEIGAMRSVEML